MSNKKISRRTVLQHGVHLSLGSAMLLGLGACGEPGSRPSACNEPGELNDSDIGMRAALGYVDVSPESGAACGACTYFTAGSNGAGCGSCQLLPGQVSGEGRCNSWSART